MGVKPEIQLDRKLIQFEKVLLHRRTEQKLELFNPTQLPISWRVTGMENMGDEFNLNESFGVIEPFQLGCPLAAIKLGPRARKTDFQSNYPSGHPFSDFCSSNGFQGIESNVYQEKY